MALLVTGIEKVKFPLAETVVVLPPLFCSTTLAPLARPESVPPTEYVLLLGFELPPPPPQALNTQSEQRESSARRQ
jgi:hypothetical protein